MVMDSTDNPPLKSDDGKDTIEEKPELIDENDPTQLYRAEVRQGTLPGDLRVRIVRPSQRAFRRVRTGLLEATKVTQAPRSGFGRVVSNIKRVLIGAPLATAQAEHERLTKF